MDAHVLRETDAAAIGDQYDYILVLADGSIGADLDYDCNDPDERDIVRQAEQLLGHTVQIIDA